MDKMKSNRFCYLVVIFLQIVMSWVCATSSSRPFALHDHAAAAAFFAHVHQPLGAGAGAGAGSGQSRHTSEINLSTKEANNMTSSSSSSMNNEEAATSLKGEAEGLAVAVVVRIGSSPPNCEHKCYGCIPCEPTQVPTAHAHVGIQDANYEPEGWKCKCGPSFYIP